MIKNENLRIEKQGETILQPITCIICREIYSVAKKPLILVCGHTFCECCLKSLFDKTCEIQCCLCKIATKLEKFEDMIVNYSILNLVEQLYPYVSTKVSEGSSCEAIHLSNDDQVDKLVYCINCSKVVCTLCQIRHKTHRLMHVSDYISTEVKSIRIESSQANRGNQVIINRLTSAFSRMSDIKLELDKIMTLEKEAMMKHFKEALALLTKVQDLVLHSLDKLSKTAEKQIEEARNEVSNLNLESKRYECILDELGKFRGLTGKQKTKILNIYNLGNIFKEIKTFNEDLKFKDENLVTEDELKANFKNIADNCCAYKRKILKVFNYVHRKTTKILEKGFNLRIYCPNKSRKKRENRMGKKEVKNGNNGNDLSMNSIQGMINATR